MSILPRLFRSQPTNKSRGALLGTDLIESGQGSMPYARRSAYDQINASPWELRALAILSVVQVEGVDFPFFTRFAVDNAQRPQRRRAANRNLLAQPQLPGTPLNLYTAPDDTPRFVGKVDATPEAWAINAEKDAALLAGLPAAFSWGGLLAAFLPATAYPDTPCRIYNEIQYHMLESLPDEGLTWSLWTSTEVEQYLAQRVVRFLVETGLIRERRDVAVSTANVDVPGDTLEINRTVWNSGSARNILVRVDKWTMDNGNVGWEADTGTPDFFIEEGDTTLSSSLSPAPSSPGTLELVIIAGLASNRDRCAPINLPAIFTPYIKWGVVADMTAKEGEASDPQKSEYAEGRYAEGIELAKLFFVGRV